MRKFRALIVASAMASLGLGGAALAQDHNGYAEIIRGDYSAAERSLVASRRTFPEHPDLTLNLAAVYRHKGRINEAVALYRDVLARPDEMVTLSAKRVESSHKLAKLALLRLDGARLSAR